jgi:DUF4097 and DUF4098 domain-containing protein YvlB
VRRVFETPNPIRLRVEIPKGRVLVVADDVAETTVELIAMKGDPIAQSWIDDAEVAQRGDEVVVLVRKHGMAFFGIGGAIEATVRVPKASAAQIGTGSGRIETDGALGDIRASTGSGHIHLKSGADIHVRSGSGDIVVDAASGSVDVKTGSGRITVGQVGRDARVATGSGHAEIGGAVGDARVTTASGNIEVGASGESVEAFAASGHVRVRRADHGRIKARTVSGHVSVGVAGGAAAWLDLNTLSGKVRSELDGGGEPGPGEKTVELRLETVSGNIDVQRA